MTRKTRDIIEFGLLIVGLGIFSILILTVMVQS